MADNLTTPIVDGTKLAFDEVSLAGETVKVGRNKIGFGADGEYTEVSGNDPLPVVADNAATATKQDEAKASLDRLSSAKSWFSIAPDDDTDLAIVPDAIRCNGDAGDVVLRGDDGGDVPFYIAKGENLPCSPVRVLSTDTTATGLVGLVA